MASRHHHLKWEKQYQQGDWPSAVPSSMIVTDDHQKWIRARSICNYYLNLGKSEDSLEPQKFLDFGCGEGRVAITASRHVARSVGYDIRNHFTENYDYDYDKTKFLLTNDWKQVRKIPKYDIILLYDVLDHVKPDRIEAVFKTVASVCKPNTKIVVRCHPWTSPHGGHVYEKVNKAFAHFFMDDEQLQKYQSEYVNKITRPMKVYGDWFKKYGFDIVSKEVIKYPWNKAKNQEMFCGDRQDRMVELGMGDPGWQISVFSIEFIDFVLKYNG